MSKMVTLSAAFVLTACVVIAWASPPVGVTPTLLARGTYDAFKVKTSPHSPVDFDARAKRPVDVIVRQHAYAPGSSTCWHTHPGPVFITVVEGEVTFYEFDDRNCTPKVVKAGEGYLDTGLGHIGLNESGAPARDITVILAPVGGSFRDELPGPGPFCAF
jgi:hypothetical protein